MTRQQARALDFIRNRIRKDGVSPNYDEIGDFMDLASRSSVHALVERLERAGHIKRIPGVARSIRLVERACPHCGGQL